MYNYKKPRKTKEQKLETEYVWNRKTWLEKHPEDLPMDAENMQARRRGFDNDGVRQLLAAVGIRACIDYKKATEGKKIEGWRHPDKVIHDCHRYFGEDAFQFFVNGMEVDEIERVIRRTPSNSIQYIWKRMEDKQKRMIKD